MIKTDKTEGELLASDLLYQTVRERISIGECLPGVHLVEADLVAEFSVSRATVRDALRKLAGDELVELLPHRGARVRRLTAQDVEELYIVREPIEGLAARLAAGSTTQDLGELQSLCLKGDSAIDEGDSRRYMQLNARLHAALLQCTGNRTLIRLANRLNGQMLSHQFFSAIDLKRMQQSQAGHREVLAAIEAADPDGAEAAMRRHIRSSRTAFRFTLTGGPQQNL